MNKKVKALIGASLAIAMSASVATGATFALFTDRADVNVEITAGTVDVDASISNIKLYSMDREQPAMEFENLGTADINTENNLLTLTNITPGDKVVFDVNLSSTSNVKTKVRTVIADESDNLELMDGLVIKVNDVEATVSGTSLASEWVAVDPSASLASDKMTVSIELPADKGNEYQTKSAKLRISLEAVQWNGVNEVTTVDGLKNAITEDANVSLSADMTLDDQIVVTDGFTILGNRKSIVQSSTASDKAIFRLDGATEDVNIKLEGLKLDGGDGVGARVLSMHNNTGDVNVVLENCTIDARHYPINIGGGNTGNVTVTIKNCTITGYSALNVWSNCTINIEDSTLIGENYNIYGTGVNAGINNFATIAINDDASNVVLNIKDSSVKSLCNEGGAIQYHFYVSDDNGGATANLTNVKFFTNDVEGAETFLADSDTRIVINK
ncbi:MAG: hypothetical protein E7353_02100 [Clostridiales bacterium]|nr:hypothetical protein [Clostridiales bacterium]